jgi:maltooligosyltrehalose trehalohydrolase
VRDFFIHNALYWLEEFHFDGLRFDAVHAIIDESSPDIIDEIAQSVRRHITCLEVHLVLENDRNEAHRLVRPRGRVERYTAQWNDDLHHVLHLLVTDEDWGYYGDYSTAPAEHLGRALAEGFAFQGAPSPFRGGEPRREPSADLPATAFVAFLQNHDQVGNRPFGTRLSAGATEPALHAAIAIVLLSPQIPLLFMGEEWASLSPFAFFCEFEPSLAASVRAGRRREFAHLPEFGDEAARDRIPDPTAFITFAQSRLDWGD